MRLRRKRDREPRPVADVYVGLRQQVLRLTPDQLGNRVPSDAPILALLMETAYPEAVATLVAVADGSASLYFSNGGGVIGAGEHPSVAEASQRWLETARTFLPQLEVSADPALPDQGITQFVSVTPEGVRATVAPEEDLGNGEHPLSTLFYSGQDVITQIRLVEESRGRPGS